MIEDREAIENIEEILAADGLDLLFFGAGDLSISYGLAMQFDHPRVVEAIESVISAANGRPGLRFGMFVDRTEIVDRWRRKGVTVFSYLSEVDIFMRACRQAVES